MLENYIKELSESSSPQEKLVKFIALTYSWLSNIGNDYGEVIYSSKETLKKGKFYFLGLNPGGEGFIKIKCDLLKFLSKDKENAICDLCWDTSKQKFGAGKSPLQSSIQYIFNDILKYEIRDVFATNLIFKTTKNSKELTKTYKELADLCWEVHLLALSIVQPEIIITCGNGEDKSAFSFISAKCDKNNEYTLIKKPLTKKEPFTNEEKFYIKAKEIDILGRRTMLIGLPHLSYFKKIKNDPFRKEFLEIINEYERSKKKEFSSQKIEHAVIEVIKDFPEMLKYLKDK